MHSMVEDESESWSSGSSDRPDQYIQFYHLCRRRLARSETTYRSNPSASVMRDPQQLRFLLDSARLSQHNSGAGSVSEKTTTKLKKAKLALVATSSSSSTMRMVVILTTTVCTLTAMFAAFVVTSSPIDPLPLVLPRFHRPTERNHNNNSYGKLECVAKLGEGLVQGPEDVAVAADGTTLLVTTRDGWVKKVRPSNGNVVDWRFVGGYPLGLAVGVHGEIIVADPVRGLLNVTDDDEEVRVVTDRTDDGLPLTFADSVTVARNGQIYFTDASSAHSLHSWHLDVLEARPHGRMLNFNPTTGRTTVLMEGLAFANGIALSPHEDFLVICESWKYRCVRYWLEGERNGTSETFIDNLPGFPDNIHLHAPSQTFWLGLVGGRSWFGDVTHRTPWLKHFFARYWQRVKPFNFARADLLAMDVNGQVVARYEDARGAVMAFATGAILHDHYLYVGSLTQNFLGRLDLDRPDCPSPVQFAHWPLH